LAQQSFGSVSNFSQEISATLMSEAACFDRIETQPPQDLWLATRRCGHGLTPRGRWLPSANLRLEAHENRSDFYGDRRRIGRCIAG
jgi:hypothetical protein